LIARAFGNGFPAVPIVGQGTWNVPLRAGARDEAIRALQAGIDLGMVHIDTAEMYGDGGAETLIGEAIAGLPRERLFLVSKVLPQHATRIPLSTWYRYRLAAEQARTALVLLTQTPCANSCAALALRCEPAQIPSFNRNGETALFEGQRYALVRERNRNEGSSFQQKKPSLRAEWIAETLWSRVR